MRVTNGELVIGKEELECNEFSKDTRTIKEGDIYIGIKGEKFDGSNFWNHALDAGATAVIISNIQISKEEKEKLLGIVGSLDSDSNKNLMREVLLPLGYNYIVSSKEIDFVVKKMSMLLADSLNNSLLLS